MINPQKHYSQWWKTESISSKIKDKESAPTPTTIIQNIVLQILATALREEKEIKRIKIRKEVKPSLFADDGILHIENSKSTIRKLLEVIHF